MRTDMKLHGYIFTLQSCGENERIPHWHGIICKAVEYKCGRCICVHIILKRSLLSYFLYIIITCKALYSAATVKISICDNGIA